MLLNRLSSHRKLHHRGGEEGGSTKNIERRSGQMGGGLRKKGGKEALFKRGQETRS